MLRVNIYSGDLCLSTSDFYLTGLLPVEFGHAYQSSSQYEGVLGYGWIHPLDVRLERKESSIVFCRNDSEVCRFTPGDGRYESASGYHLQRTDRGWIVNDDGEGQRYFFVGEIGVLSAIEDRHGNRLLYEQDSAGRVSAIIDPFRRRIEIAYSAGRLVRITLTRHADQVSNIVLVEFWYDQDGRLISKRDQNGNQESYGYVGNKLVSFTNACGGQYCAAYDREGRCIQTWEAQGKRSRQFLYDSAHRTTRVIDALGYSTVYRFDEMGLPIEKIDACGGITKYVRDETGGLLATILPTGEVGRLSQFEVEAGVYSYTTLSGATTKYEFDEAGEVAAVVDACGHRWHYDHDARGNLIRRTTPRGFAWEFTYTERGQMQSVRDPGGWVTEYTMSDDGLQQSRRDALGHLVTKRFDVLGRLTRIEQIAGGITVVYEGLRERVSNVDGTSRLYEYDPQGELVRYVDEMGNAWSNRYDRYRRCLVQIDPLGNETRYEYDAEGRVVTVINENGDLFATYYDGLGRITKQVGFDGVTREFSYDEVGRLRHCKNGNGAYVHFERDALGMPLSRRYENGEVSTSAYDALGRRVGHEEPTGTLEIEYDSEGQVVRETNGTLDVTFKFDWRPFPYKLTCGEREQEFSYDSRGRLQSVTEASDFAATLSYDETRRSRFVVFKDGLKIERRYGDRGWLEQQRVVTPDGAVLIDDRYEYDARGLLLQRNRAGSSNLSFKHNERGELVSVIEDGVRLHQYVYDKAGNRSQSGESLVYARGNRLQESTRGLFAYDGEGRPVTCSRNGERYEYAYDNAGRVSVVSAGDRHVSFTYDGLFRRQEKVSEEGTRRTLWTGDMPFQEEFPDGRHVAYVYDITEEAPLGVCIDGEWHATVVDWRGEVTDLIRTRDRRLTWSATPLGFHSTVKVDEVGNSFVLRGPGQMFDQETGLVYQRARYYDAGMGRFLTPDPIGLEGGFNLYQYCLNRPFEFVDPLGLAEKKPCEKSKDECDKLFENMQHRIEHTNPQGKREGLKRRFEDMENPKDVLPWFKADAVTKGGTYTPFQAKRADGSWITTAEKAMGSVESHLENYEQEQKGLNDDLTEYYKGKCQTYEDKERKKEMQGIRQWGTRKPVLGGAYPAPPPGLAGRFA